MAQPSQAVSRASGLPTRVLCVDDDEGSLQIIGDLLEQDSDIDVRPCNQPAEAVALALDFQPDVFLVDIRMGQVDGLALMDELVACQEFSEAPFIMMSNVADPMQKARCFARGVSDYLVKFPDHLELCARVRYHANANRKHQALESLRRELVAQTEHMEAELQFAAGVQHEILTKPPQTPYLRSAVLYLPYSLVSGDFYHFGEHGEDGCSTFIGDATGHGIASAFITIMANMGLAQVEGSMGSDQVLAKLNDVLVPAIPGGHFMTGIATRISPAGLLTLSSGGHPPLLVAPADASELRALKCTGLPLGIVRGDYATLDYQLVPGDRVYLYTDGVFEQENLRGERFGEGQLREFLSSHRHLCAAELIQALNSTLREFAGNADKGDDITLIAIDYLGQPTG